MSMQALAQKFYIGFYGRPADPAGLDYWTERLENEGVTKVLDAFANSPEGNAFVYKNPLTGDDYSYSELVENIYQNLFGREPDPAGHDFYVGKLESGEMSLVTIVNNIMRGALDDVGPNPDRDVLMDKYDVASHFTQNLGDRIYSDDQILDARELLEGVITDVNQAKQAVENVINSFPGVDEPEEQELTVSVEDVTVPEGETASVTVTVDNPTESEVQGFLDLMVWDEASGEDFYWDEIESFTVQPQGTAQHTFSFAADFGSGEFLMDSYFDAGVDLFYFSDYAVLTVSSQDIEDPDTDMGSLAGTFELTNAIVDIDIEDAFSGTLVSLFSFMQNLDLDFNGIEIDDIELGEIDLGDFEVIDLQELGLVPGATFVVPETGLFHDDMFPADVKLSVLDDSTLSMEYDGQYTYQIDYSFDGTSLEVHGLLEAFRDLVLVDEAIDFEEHYGIDPNNINISDLLEVLDDIEIDDIELEDIQMILELSPEIKDLAQQFIDDVLMTFIDDLKNADFKDELHFTKISDSTDGDYIGLSGIQDFDMDDIEFML